MISPMAGVLERENKMSFIHYTLSNPQIRCVAADILWQPSSLPCLGTNKMDIMPKAKLERIRMGGIKVLQACW